MPAIPSEMNPTTVAGLQADQTVTLFLLVWEKEIRTGQQSGKPYLRLALGDRTGTIEARMWEGFEDSVKDVSRNDFVKVQGRVEAYRGRNQLIIEKVRKAKDGEVQPEDFLPRTSEDVEQLYARLICVVRRQRHGPGFTPAVAGRDVTGRNVHCFSGG